MRRLFDRFASPQSLSGSKNRPFDGWIARAAAERVFQRKADGFAVGVRVALEQGIRRHDLAGDAESALDCALFHKGFLQRVQFHFLMDVLCKPFNGDDGFAIGALSWIHAGHGRLTVHKDSTRAALGFFATDLCTGKMKPYAEKGCQSLARLGFQSLLNTVNCKIYFVSHGLLFLNFLVVE
jgi:hypothetical protein